MRKVSHTLKRQAYGIDPCDRCNPPIAYIEHSITLDCGHGRNCGGVAVVSSALLKDLNGKCYNINGQSLIQKGKLP